MLGMVVIFLTMDANGRSDKIMLQIGTLNIVMDRYVDRNGKEFVNILN